MWLILDSSSLQLSIGNATRIEYGKGFSVEEHGVFHGGAGLLISSSVDSPLVIGFRGVEGAAEAYNRIIDALKGGISFVDFRDIEKGHK